jgi:membrane protein YdbS with pleckstrin-like domain
MAVTSVRLQPSEKIVLDIGPSAFWTGPLYVFTLGLWAIWRRHHRFVVTSQRIMTTVGIVSKKERAVPLSRVQDVTLRRPFLRSSSVLLSTAGGQLGLERIGPLSRAKAAKFADALQARIGTSFDGVSGAPMAAAGSSIAAELEHLDDLRQRGTISDEEFRVQKAKLLG